MAQVVAKLWNNTCGVNLKWKGWGYGELVFWLTCLSCLCVVLLFWYFLNPNFWKEIYLTHNCNSYRFYVGIYFPVFITIWIVLCFLKIHSSAYSRILTVTSFLSPNLFLSFPRFNLHISRIKVLPGFCLKSRMFLLLNQTIMLISNKVKLFAENGETMMNNIGVERSGSDMWLELYLSGEYEMGWVIYDSPFC